MLPCIVSFRATPYLSSQILFSGVKIDSAPYLSARSHSVPMIGSPVPSTCTVLADYLARRPEMVGQGTESAFLTTGDPRKVSDGATRFLKRKIEFRSA